MAIPLQNGYVLCFFPFSPSQRVSNLDLTFARDLLYRPGCAVIHIGQALYFRLWWLLPTACLAGVTEILGWSGRLWSSLNIGVLDPYLMQ